MTHQRHPSNASSYNPVIIDPSVPLTRPTPPKPSPIHLRYPYPLPIASLLDLAYTMYESVGPSPRVRSRFLVIALGRCGVLGGFVGLSKKWRNRGGWVAGVSTTSVLGVVWEVCQERMLRSQPNMHPQNPQSVPLMVTAMMAIAEYLLFLLLLRLSPPSHRLNPFALRVPRSAIQSPARFHFTSSSTTYDSDTPSRPDMRSTSPVSPTTRRHTRRQSRLSVMSRPDEEYDEPMLSPPDAVHETEEEDLEDDASDISSISESSIIDLPPPQEPSQIDTTSALAMTNNLDLTSLENSPVLGPLVRRTKSSRLLSGSWGRQVKSRGMAYGTFGLGPGANGHDDDSSH